MSDQREEEKEKDHPLSGQLELRDFLSKLLGEDLAHNPGISDDRCEQWLLKRKRHRRKVAANTDWLDPKG